MINVHFKLPKKKLWHTLLMPRACKVNGIQWCTEEEADLTVIDFRRLSEITREPDILFVPIDSADLTDDEPWFARQSAHRAKMLLRSIQLAHDLDNHPKVQGRWFGTRILPSSSLPERNRIPSRAINSMLWHRHITKHCVLKETKEGINRRIDVSYMGTSTTYKRPHIKMHRQAVIHESRKLSNNLNTRIGGRLGIAKYLKVMNNSKIVISPWGWGPLCYRDFEATLRGCTIIKPCHSAFETTPNPLIDHSVYHCDPLFRNLSEVIDQALKNWREDFDRNLKNRQRLMKLLINPRFYFNQLKKVLNETIEIKDQWEIKTHDMASKDTTDKQDC